MDKVWREPHHIVIEVINRRCRIFQKLASYGLKNFKVVDIRGSAGQVKHMVELGSNDAKRISSELPEIQSRRIAKERSSIWFESVGCDVCDAILSCAAFLVSGKSVGNYTVRYSFMVPDFEIYKNIISAIENVGLKANVLKMGKFEPRTEVLTEKQEKVLWVALKAGFLDFPRRIGTTELSQKLGISPSTLSEITRRGTRRLFENYFEG